MISGSDKHISSRTFIHFRSRALSCDTVEILGECTPLQACADHEEIAGSNHRGRWRAWGSPVPDCLPQVCPG